MKRPISLTIDELLYQRLHGHLFPGDNDEHGAVIAAGIAETERGTRLLAREVFLARDGIDYVPGQRGYRALTAQFVAEQSDYCAAQNLCYLAVHCHGGTDEVGFSGDDLASHRRGYPALLDITGGGPVGALVLARNALAGDIWTTKGCYELDYTNVVGSRVRRLFPNPRPRPRHAAPLYDRSARLFGDLGQEILTSLKVGIIGLGGGGSLINEWLARLGIGHIVAVDFDRIELSNLPRIVGATRWDAMSWLAGQRSEKLRRLGKRFASRKVDVARRVARRANPSIRFDAVSGNVLDESTAKLLVDVDFLFLASDSIQSRLVFNAIIHQYLIPGVQIGAKVPVIQNNEVGDAFVATRPVLPYAAAGCLSCHELIPASLLQEEALTESERTSQRYIDCPDVVEPSVITLNVLSAAQAVNDMMMIFTGLYREGVKLPHQIHFVRERLMNQVESMADEFCPDCSNTVFSRRARGDRVRLPCRE